MRRARIVCTIGPATESPEQVQVLVDAGMDVARLNRSHGDTAWHEQVYRNVRAAALASGRPVAVLVDLQGPKIRLGAFGDGPHELAVGDVLTITTQDVVGTRDRVSTTHPGLAADVHPGDPILVDDGKVQLRVTAVDGTEVVTRVEVPGTVSDHKGLNLPGAAVSVPALSDKDEQDLRWALKVGADVVALSFVRSAADYHAVRRVMEDEGRIVPVIAKIEKPQAVDNLPEIVRAFDGIMVARGDLGVELALDRVPLVQKDAVAMARQQAKPVIVATQVLESMITAPRPTRAEASDCANAVLDGADAVMLSGETSIGKYPVEAVRTMSRIIETTESSGLDRIAPLVPNPMHDDGPITRAAVQIGTNMDVKYLVTFTESGGSARRLSRLRPEIPILAFTPVEHTRNMLSLSWGAQTYMVPEVGNTDDMVRLVDLTLRANRLAEFGDLVVVVAGTPVGQIGSTNTLLVHRIGEEDGPRPRRS